jgi:hypothetical protein
VSAGERVDGKGSSLIEHASRYLRWAALVCTDDRETGIINMMIVVPMLIQSVTFGWIYANLLGDNPNNAIVFAGVLLGLAGLTTLWIKEPPIVRDVDDVT